MEEFLSKLILNTLTRVTKIERLGENYYSVVVDGMTISGTMDYVIEDLRQLHEGNRFDKDEVINIALYTASQLSGVKVEVFTSKTRKREIIYIRQFLHKMIYESFKYQISLEYIAHRIGNKRTHATVLHSIKTVNDLIETDKTYAELYDKYLEAYKENLRTAQYNFHEHN